MREARKEARYRARHAADDPRDSLSACDNRRGNRRGSSVTGASAMEFRKMQSSADDFGPWSTTPLNTASTQSRITYIDGDRGSFSTALSHRALAERCTFEVAYLLIHGELP